MERRGLAAGNVTQEQLTRAIQTALANNRVLFQAQSASASPANNRDAVPRFHLFNWNGAFHRLPASFVLTAMGTGRRANQFRTPEQAYMRWHLADDGNNLPALKKCTPSDFKDKNQRKRFSDWVKMTSQLDALLVRYQVEVHDEPTPAQYREQFRAAFQIHWAKVRCLHPSKRKRKQARNIEASLRVSTVLKDMRLVTGTITRLWRSIMFTSFVMTVQAKVRAKIQARIEA